MACPARTRIRCVLDRAPAARISRPMNATSRALSEPVSGGSVRVASGASPWPARFAWWTWFACIPLVFLGGSVTSTGAGLAIDGWWVVDPGKGDWFLPLYPLENWIHAQGPFVEHTHRLCGMLVGVLSIATVVSAFVSGARTLGRVLACAGLAAVIVQGTLGGFRVLEKSRDLAFLHGAVGQGVFALLGVAALALAVRVPPVATNAELAKLRRIALATTLVVYAQIVVGAWLRHGQSMAALATHVLFVLAVAAHVLLVASAARKAEAAAAEPARIARLRRWLFAAFWVQITLGLLAFTWVYVVIGHGKTPTELHQSLFPTLHVVGGAALLFASAALLVEAWRRVAAAAEPAR